MKKYILVLIFFQVCYILHAQSPLIKAWDKRYGGTDQDYIMSLQQTIDKGFILGGGSISWAGADKSQNCRGMWDYWVVKIDKKGTKEWDKRFGGTDQDILCAVIQTNDSNYLLGGFTLSNNNWDVTEPSRDTSSRFENRGDFWIVKIDSLGTKLWDKRYGGYLTERFTSMQQTSDNGYILGGSSASDSSGDKTENSRDTAIYAYDRNDFWIIKIDSLGNRQWDKRYGGSQIDQLNSLQQTSDGGYILGGTSLSDSSGDKSENNRDTIYQTGARGDYWIIKIDSLGNKQWDKRFGGPWEDFLHHVSQTKDGGYILGGEALYSGGDITQPCQGGSDYWTVKVDPLGNMQWEKRYGGSDYEDIHSILELTDGGYLLTGDSYSPMSGDKTENNLGQEQTWLVKIDSIGNMLWDKTIFSLSHDETAATVFASDECFLTGISSHSPVAGYKTQPAWNNMPDYWVIKFCDSTLYTNINSIDESEFQLDIFPNPFNTDLKIVIRKENIDQISIKIIDILGKEVFKYLDNKIIQLYSKTLNLTNLSPGIYFLVVEIDGVRTERKIIKN